MNIKETPLTEKLFELRGMIQYVETYKDNLMKNDPKTWWEQYGKQLLK